ncbi:MAG TPA: hypothetical protein PKH09_09700 [Parvularculaceae bacterium]|nr:hypothetical protein [Parvularculaceae bacterium]
MTRGFLTALSFSLLAAGCVTTERTEAYRAQSLQRLADVKETNGDQKASLNASLEEYGKVTLLDDETGEEKIICKYEKTTGSRFGRKICATPREWDQKRIDSQENARKTQRSMNARCPANGTGGTPGAC